MVEILKKRDDREAEVLILMIITLVLAVTTNLSLQITSGGVSEWNEDRKN